MIKKPFLFNFLLSPMIHFLGYLTVIKKFHHRYHFETDRPMNRIHAFLRDLVYDK